MILILDTTILRYASKFELPRTDKEELKQESCRQLIRLLEVQDCPHVIAYSQDILDEYYPSRSKRYHTTPNPCGQSVEEYVNKFLRAISTRVLQLTPNPLLNSVKTYLERERFDNDDIKFVELAVSEQITLIISEDSDDYKVIKDYLQQNFGIDVLTAKDALLKLSASKS